MLATEFTRLGSWVHAEAGPLGLGRPWAAQSRARRSRLCCLASQPSSEGGPPRLNATASGSSSGLSSGGSTGGSGRRTSPVGGAEDLLEFRLAGQRLQSLLAGTGDGEEEFVNQMITEQTPEQKLALSVIAGGVLSGAAILLCWLVGVDPLGGASLSLHSLQAAAVGGLASLPLVALKYYLWSDHGKQQICWVEDWHRAQVECFKPLMLQLSPAQTALFTFTEVLPGVLILLPAACGGIDKALRLYCNLVGADVPEAVTLAVALVATAALAGVAKLGENAMTYEEYDVIKAAIDNADRYYRVTAMSRDAGVADAKRAADAFKVVALTWMARSQLVSQLAGVLAAVEVAYLGVMWHETGDLAAPLTAALAASAVDFWHIRRQIIQPARRGT